MIKLAPSILSADFSRLGEQIAEIARANVDYLHIDVMDGHFVPNISIGIPVIESLKKITNIPLDVHLMITDPHKYINDFATAGADIITVHIETDLHMHRLMESIKKLNVKAGIALNPSTSPVLLEEVLYLADLILIMCVDPGFGGQKFIPESINKISRLKRILDSESNKVELEVDGGISEANVADVVKAGANVIVAGNAIFSSCDIYIAATRMRELINLAG